MSSNISPEHLRVILKRAPELNSYHGSFKKFPDGTFFKVSGLWYHAESTNLKDSVALFCKHVNNSCDEALIIYATEAVCLYFVAMIGKDSGIPSMNRELFINVLIRIIREINYDSSDYILPFFWKMFVTYIRIFTESDMETIRNHIKLIIDDTLPIGACKSVFSMIVLNNVPVRPSIIIPGTIDILIKCLKCICRSVFFGPGIIDNDYIRFFGSQ